MSTTHKVLLVWILKLYKRSLLEWQLFVENKRILFENNEKSVKYSCSDMEKVASGASAACGHVNAQIYA